MADQEGDTATGPNGQTAIFTGGQWRIQTPPKSTWEDVKNVAGPSLVQGAAGLASSPRSLYDMGTGLVDWGLKNTLDRVLPEKIVQNANKVREDPSLGPNLPKWPSNEDVMGAVERVTGKKFDEQAETPVGAAVQTAGQILPSMLAGPGSLARKAASTAGATAGSEAGGWLADKLDIGPKTDAVLRFLGGVLGTHAPTAIRRAATPMPRSPAEAAKVAELDAALKPYGATTRSGQAKGPGWINQLEEDNAYSIATPSALKPVTQQSAFGQFAQREAGVPAPSGSAASRGVTEPGELGPHMRQTGQSIEDLYSTAKIPNLDPQLMSRTSKVFQNATPQTRTQLEPITDKLTYRPTAIGTTGQEVAGKGYLAGPNTTTPGPQWRQLENQVGQLADTASGGRDTQTAAALRQFAQALKQTAERAVPGLSKQRENYTNAKALEIARGRAGSTLAANEPPLPHDVYSALGSTKNPAATSNRLGKIADIAGQHGVGDTIKNPTSRFAHDVTSGLLGAAIGGGGTYLGAGGSEPYGAPILGSIIGGGLMAKARSNPLTAALLMNRGTQGWLKNNKFLPGGKHTALTNSYANRFALGAPHPYFPEEEQ